MLETAGLYADLFALRAYDATHLAAAKRLVEVSGAAVSFACFDQRLNRAAGIVGLSAPFLVA